MKYLYLLESDGFYKIGVASHPRGRIAELQTGNPHKINLVVSCLVENAYGAEWYMHTILSKLKVSGEWFRLPSDVVDILKEVYVVLENSKPSSSDTMRPQWISILDRIK